MGCVIQCTPGDNVTFENRTKNMSPGVLMWRGVLSNVGVLSSVLYCKPRVGSGVRIPRGSDF